MRQILPIASNYGRFLVGIAAVAVVMPQAIAALGIERFGLWALAAATCGFIALLELGVATTAVRFAAEAEGSGDPRLRNTRLSTLLVAQAPLALAMLLAGWLGAAPIAALLGLDGRDAAEFASVVRIGATAAALALPLCLWRAALAARGLLHLSNCVDAVAIAAGACVSLAGLAQGHGLLALASGSAVTVLLPAPLLWLAARRRVPAFELGWRSASRSEWRHMRSFAGAAVSANSANLAAQRMEPVLVHAFLSLAAVGHFSVAARIAEYAVLLGRQFSSALTPAIARAHGAGDADAIRTTLLLGTRFHLALMLPGALLLGWHAPALLNAWLGPVAIAAQLPLRLLCVALAFAAVAMNAAICLGMTGRHRFVAQAAVGGAALRLAAGALMLGPLGLAGPGIAAILAAIVIDSGLVVARACRHLGVPVRRFWAQAVLPSIPGLVTMTLVASLLDRWQPASSLAAVTVQGAVAFVSFATVFVWVGLPRGFLRSRLPRPFREQEVPAR
jgi:O-antigen/teichoic acid export membrane protein